MEARRRQRTCERRLDTEETYVFVAPNEAIGIVVSPAILATLGRMQVTLGCEFVPPPGDASSSLADRSEGADEP